MNSNKSLRLPDKLRAELAKPIDNLIAGSEEDLGQAVNVIADRISKQKPILVVTVGDIVTKSFNAQELPMNLAIVDFIVKREEKFKSLSELGFQKKHPDVTVNNPKGMLTGELIKTVEDFFLSLRAKRSNLGEIATPRQAGLAMTTPYIIRVIGEEDLATLAVILAAPLNTHVFYGQPDEGIVQVIVSQEKKAEVKDIVSQFEIA